MTEFLTLYLTVGFVWNVVVVANAFCRAIVEFVTCRVCYRATLIRVLKIAYIYAYIDLICVFLKNFEKSFFFV